MVIGTHLLNKAATATSPSLDPNSDSQGGDAETHSNHATSPTLNIRYFAATGKDLIVAGREDEDVSHVGYVLPDRGIVREDRITVTADSKTFTVVAVLPPSKDHHLKLQMKELHSDA